MSEARARSSQPADFYDFDVNWGGSVRPMHGVTMNPPLVGYYIAGVAALFGWSEVHLVIENLDNSNGQSESTPYMVHGFQMPGGVRGNCAAGPRPSCAPFHGSTTGAVPAADSAHPGALRRGSRREAAERSRFPGRTAGPT